MQIARNARSFCFERVLTFDAFAFADFALELGGALFYQSPQLRNPDRCESQNHQQYSYDNQQPLQRPPRRLREDNNVSGRIYQQVKGFGTCVRTLVAPAFDANTFKRKAAANAQRNLSRHSGRESREIQMLA